MLGYYVIMVATLGMTVTAGMTILASATAGERLAQASRDAQALHQAEAALRETLVFDAEGRVFAPMADTSDGPSDDIPQWISSQNFAPSSGARFGYCPYAVVPAPDAEALPSAKIKSNPNAATQGNGTANSRSYDVRTRDRAARGGQLRAYVEKGKRAGHGRDVGTPPEVVAFVIGPARGGTAVAACDQIFWDGRTWQVDTTGGQPGGVVRAITRDTIAVEAANRSQAIRRTVARVASGDGTSRDDPGLLDRALAEWQALRPARMTIEFLPEANSAASYEVTQAMLDQIGFAAAGATSETFGRTLQLAAIDGSGTVRLRAESAPGSSAPATLRSDTDLTLSGLWLDNIVLEIGPGVRAILEDATLTRLINRGGEVVIRGATAVGADGLGAAAIISRGGSLTIAEGAALQISTGNTAPAALDLDGAQLRVDGTLRASQETVPLFAKDRSFLASYGASGKAIRNATDLTEQSDTRMRVTELSGMRYDALGSNSCAAGRAGRICRRTPACDGVLIETSCTSASDQLRLMSMRTVRSPAGEAYLECIWSQDALSDDKKGGAGAVDGEASASCLPIRLDGLTAGSGG